MCDRVKESKNPSY